MGKRIQVLVIEDEAHIRQALEYNLRLDGFEVFSAEDGFDGLKLAREKRPALILLDWMMPEMDGMEVLRKLKTRKETKNIPVFMLTAKGTIGDVDRGFAVGADEYITKPFDVQKLGGILKTKMNQLAKS